MVYIQSDIEKKIPHHFDAACALYGAIDSGLNYRLTSYQEIEEGKFDLLLKNRVFVGSVEFLSLVFKRLGIPNVKLPSNSNRKSEIITIKQARDIAKSGTDIFIKPTQAKLFTGFVLDQMQYPSINSLPDDTLVISYKPFEHPIESEWRIYIHNHKMVDAKNYSGDFTTCPNYDYIQEVINKNKGSFPCAYTIDIGILSSKENVVVEYNDMWAIGNYGIPNDLYYRLLKDRYFEITNNYSIY